MKEITEHDHVTLYQAISPQQLAILIDNGWQSINRHASADRFCFLKLHQRYAEMIARQALLPAEGAAYVVRMELPRQVLGAYALKTIAYEEHLEYQIPVESLPFLSNRLIGKVHIVAAFHDQHSYSVPLGGRLSARLIA